MDGGIASTVTYQRERIFTLWNDLAPLLREHYEEIETFRDIRLDPDHAAYNKFEEIGILRTYTARRDGRLIGYAIFLFAANPHHKTSLQAKCDVVFVPAAERRGRVGSRLLEFAHEQLAADGAEVIAHHVKLDHPQLGRLLESMGFEPNEMVYVTRTRINKRRIA